MFCRKKTSADRRYPCRSAAFTLVEMLVVMGVIAVLLAVLLPAVRGLSNSSSRHGAVGTLLGVLDRARMMAVADGQATYVVFAVPGGDGQQLRKDLWGHAYAIYEDHDNILFTPEQRTPWMQLPQGMAFKINGNGGQFSSVTNRVLQAGTDPAFPVGPGALGTAGSSAKVQLPYWKFDSTGGVDEQTTSYLRLLMFPGLIDAGGNEVPTQNANGGANASPMLLEEIDINSATGRAKYIINPINNLATPHAGALDVNDSPPFPARRARRAFSLIEITIALGIVTFALVGVVGVLPVAMNSGRQSVDKNRAAAIAGTLYTSFRSQPFQSVCYLDEQCDANGQPLAMPAVPPLDLNARTTTSPEVTCYATFLDNTTAVTATSDPYGARRRLYFGRATTGGADYLVRMHFNNQPAGTVITPAPGASANTQPAVPAEANQVELIVSPVSRPQDQYRFMSIVANRTN